MTQKKLILLLPLKFSYFYLIFITMLATTIMMNFFKSSLAQNSKPIAENLPDGIYLYGETPLANQPGRNYITFRKTGHRLTGRDYVRNSDGGSCIKGNIKGNVIQDVVAIDRGVDIFSPKLTLVKKNPLNLNKYHKIDEPDTQVDLRKLIENCESDFKKLQ